MKSMFNIKANLPYVITGASAIAIIAFSYLNYQKKSSLIEELGEATDALKKAETIMSFLPEKQSQQLLQMANKYNELLSSPEYGKDSEEGRLLVSEANELKEAASKILKPSADVSQPSANSAIKESLAR